MSVTRKQSAGKVVITIEGRFDHKMVEEFRTCYAETRPGPGTPFVIDLGQTADIDKRGLGVLLGLRGHAGGPASKIEIININDKVREAFDRYSFDGLFTLH